MMHVFRHARGIAGLLCLFSLLVLTSSQSVSAQQSDHAGAFGPVGSVPADAAGVPRTDDRPNVVCVIADDLGYGETGMMGNLEIPTPNIDHLAADGVRCTSGYVTSSYCSPSRAGIFTGRYQSRFGYDMNPTGKRNLLPQAGLPRVGDDLYPTT